MKRTLKRGFKLRETAKKQTDESRMLHGASGGFIPAVGGSPVCGVYGGLTVLESRGGRCLGSGALPPFGALPGDRSSRASKVGAGPQLVGGSSSVLSHARLASRPRERARTFSAVTASAVLRSDGPRGPAVVTTGDRPSARFRVTRCPDAIRLGLARVCRARARLSRPTRLETRTKERSRPASRRDSANPTRRNESEPPAVSAGG